MKPSIILLLILLLLPGAVLAQDDEEDDACPGIVEQALQAADAACQDTGRNEACYGHFDVQATLTGTAGEVTFGSSGDRLPLADLVALRLAGFQAESDAWGVVLLRVQANLPDTAPGQNVTLLLFGDVSIENEGSANLPSLPVTVNSSANLRGGPGTDFAVVGGVTAGDALTARGRDAAGTWLNVELPDGRAAWLFANLATVDGDLLTLPEASSEGAAAAHYGPMQAFRFHSGVGDAGCEAMPESGLMIQTPRGAGKITLLINEVRMEIGSTVYLQAQPDQALIVRVLEGAATISAAEETVIVPAGAQSAVPLNEAGLPAGPPEPPVPLEQTPVQAAPLDLLLEPVETVAPLDEAAIADAVQAIQLADDPLATAAGNWVSQDRDGSSQVLSLGYGGDGSYSLTLVDDGATACGTGTNDVPLYAANASGSATFDGTTLSASFEVICQNADATNLGGFEFAWTYDAASDTLTDVTGVIWQRS